ncbi:MAG: AAA family ATPase, partial [Pseudomonadota bacterium]
FGLLAGAPLSVLTGPAGCGKTALLLHLLDNADDSYRIAKADAGLSTDGILSWLLQALGEPMPDPAAGPSTALAALHALMIAEYAEGRSTVLLIDEAHHLSDGDLQALCLLSNINTAQDRLMQIVLSGHPVLRARLIAPAFDDMAQRVGVWASVRPLSDTGTADYIADRLMAVEAAADLFDAGAVDLIHRTTGGIPRQINKLCELSLIFAAAEEGDRIGAEAVQNVLAEGFFLPPSDDAPQGGAARPARLTIAAGG